MRKIFTRSPFYLSVKEEYIEPEIIIPDEGDPIPEPEEDPTEPENDPPTQSSQNISFGCNATQTQNGFVGTSVYSKDYDFLLADIATSYTVSGTPAKFTFTWDSTVVTTGYVGSDVYDDQLIAAGVQLSEINTTAGTEPVTGILEISKTTEQPKIVTLTIHTPLIDSNITIQNTCDIQSPAPQVEEVYICYIQAKQNTAANPTMTETITFNSTPLQGKDSPSLATAPLETVEVKTVKNSTADTVLVFGNINGYQPNPSEPKTVPNINFADYIRAAPINFEEIKIYTCDINLLKINNMNVFRMSNSYGSTLKKYDIRWYKGEIYYPFGDQSVVTNVCLVNDVSKDFGFSTGTLPFTDVYPIVKNICK